MPKLTYWRAECLEDHASYSLRAKTKKEVVALREHNGRNGYDEVEKVTIEYRDAFHLMAILMGEGGTSYY
jgi:hypothetical protein